MRNHNSTDNKFKYKVAVLREIIQKNRDAHKVEYETALTIYKKDVIELLEKRLAAAKADKEYSLEIKLTKPCAYLSEYDRALRMFELTCQEEVELDSESFAQLVMDEWDWSHSFKATNSMYLNK